MRLTPGTLIYFAPFATASLTLGLLGCSRLLGMRSSLLRGVGPHGEEPRFQRGVSNHEADSTHLTILAQLSSRATDTARA
jgi:hypothetical protein